MLLEMSFAPAGTFYDKIVSLSIYAKRMMKVVTNVCNANSDATFWRFLSRTQNRQLCCLVIVAHVVLPKRRFVTTKLQEHLLVWRSVSANHNQPHPNLYQKGRNLSFHDIIVSILQWLIRLTKTSFPFSFSKLSVYSTTTWVSQFPTTVLIGLSTLDQIQLL